jgi:hypothetical protein
VELTLRGREKAFPERGLAKLEEFLTKVTTPITRQREPMRGPYGWVLVIQKDKKATAKPTEPHGKIPQE